MRIVIDLRLLDGPSSFRGIGAYARTITHEIIPQLIEDNHQVSLLVYSRGNIKYLSSPMRKACNVVVVPKRPSWITKRLRARIASVVERLDYLPRSSIRHLGKIDRFFQISNEFGLPKLKAPAKTVLVAHDIAPLRLEGFFKVNLNFNPVSWLKVIYKQRQKHVFIKRLKHYKRADRIIAVSKFTKKDIIKEFSLNPNKVITAQSAAPSMPKPNINKQTYRTKPYLFFVGGLDKRRDMSALFEAMRILKRDNPKIKLLLAGKDFEYADTLVPHDLKGTVKLLGYISDQEKSDYMAGALASVYPSFYEGFGFPILEALAVDCPIITYKNSSISEVGGDAAIYVKTPKQIAEEAIKLTKATHRKTVISAGRRQIAKFSWRQTAQTTLSVLGKK